jgi:hypothetical protein
VLHIFFSRFTPPAQCSCHSPSNTLLFPGVPFRASARRGTHDLHFATLDYIATGTVGVTATKITLIRWVIGTKHEVIHMGLVKVSRVHLMQSLLEPKGRPHVPYHYIRYHEIVHTSLTIPRPDVDLRQLALEARSRRRHGTFGKAT